MMTHPDGNWRGTVIVLLEQAAAQLTPVPASRESVHHCSEHGVYVDSHNNLVAAVKTLLVCRRTELEAEEHERRTGEQARLANHAALVEALVPFAVKAVVVVVGVFLVGLFAYAKLGLR